MGALGGATGGLMGGFGGGFLGGGGGGGGGPLGMMGMDMSPHKMPVIGGFFQNPMEQHKQRQFSQAGRAYGAYRPEMAQARMNAMRNQMGAYQGANNVMAAMMGGAGRGPNVEQLQRNPMGPGMMKVGQSKTGQPRGSGPAFGGFNPILGMNDGFGGLGGFIGGPMGLARGFF